MRYSAMTSFLISFVTADKNVTLQPKKGPYKGKHYIILIHVQQPPSLIQKSSFARMLGETLV